MSTSCVHWQITNGPLGCLTRVFTTVFVEPDDRWPFPTSGDFDFSDQGRRIATPDRQGFREVLFTTLSGLNNPARSGHPPSIARLILVILTAASLASNSSADATWSVVVNRWLGVLQCDALRETSPSHVADSDPLALALANHGGSRLWATIWPPRGAARRQGVAATYLMTLSARPARTSLTAAPAASAAVPQNTSPTARARPGSAGPHARTVAR